MTNKDYENLNQRLTKLKNSFNIYNSSKEQFNKNLIEIVSNFQLLEKEIYSLFFSAKIQFWEQIKLLNKKISKYQQKKVVNIQLLEDLINEKENLPKPNLKANKTVIEQLKKSIQEIEDKLTNLNIKIEEINLDIDEENEILERINNLDKEKSKKLKKVKDMTQNIIETLENNEYYVLLNLIEVLQQRIEEIETKLINLFNSRIMTHKECLSSYHKIKSFELIKKRLNSDFNKNLILLNHYNETFKENINDKELFREIFKRLQRGKEIKKKKSRREILIIKKKRLLKKLKEERKKKALDKKKAGKRLDFYELRLIMDKLDKER